MAFTETDIATAAAIVRIFETGKAVGDPTACVVLNDGAGITYGSEQFTHASGSLTRVVERYLDLGGQVAAATLRDRLPVLRDVSPKKRYAAASDDRLRKALRAAGITAEMRQAQSETARKLYVLPALREADARRFAEPLSLAVVYDSFIHGSWEKIAARIDRRLGPIATEKAWVTAYVRERDLWLASIARLAATRYRTRFFLTCIALGRWELALPMTVRGVRLREGLVLRAAQISKVEGGEKPAENTGRESSGPQLSSPETTSDPGQEPQAALQPETRTAGEILDEIEKTVDAVAARYDQTERIVTGVAVRKDSSKSLWTTLISTLWQPVWAVYAFFAGLPREVWLVVAIAVAAFGIFYLYRQFIFGRIREVSAMGERL